MTSAYLSPSFISAQVGATSRPALLRFSFVLSLAYLSVVHYIIKKLVRLRQARLLSSFEKNKKIIIYIILRKFTAAYKRRELNKVQLAQRLDVSRPTLNKLIKQHEQEGAK